MSKYCPKCGGQIFTQGYPVVTRDYCSCGFYDDEDENRGEPLSPNYMKNKRPSKTENRGEPLSPDYQP